MSRASLLSLAALGVILAGCAPTAPEVGLTPNALTPNALVAEGSAAEFPEPAAGITLKNGKPMIPFKMVSTKGQTITNASTKGKVVLLDFWATWCGPCKKASPTMQKLHQKYAKSGLMVIGANTGEEPSDAEGAAAGYAKEHGYTYTFTKKNDALSAKIGNEGIPFFVFIDRKGNVSETVTGFSPDMSPAMFEKKTKQLLAQR